MTNVKAGDWCRHWLQLAFWPPQVRLDLRCSGCCREGLDAVHLLMLELELQVQSASAVCGDVASEFASRLAQLEALAEEFSERIPLEPQQGDSFNDY